MWYLHPAFHKSIFHVSDAPQQWLAVVVGTRQTETAQIALISIVTQPTLTCCSLLLVVFDNFRGALFRYIRIFPKLLECAALSQ